MLDPHALTKYRANSPQLIVIASIHQPSTTTFQLFDKLLLLSRGRSHYFGPVSGVEYHFASVGFPMPNHINPAEFILELMNTDFAVNHEQAAGRLDQLHRSWASSRGAASLALKADSISRSAGGSIPAPKVSRNSFFVVVLALLHRSFIKSYRDVVAYGIRIAMYFGLAVMMGTIWLRLKTDQSNIQPVINAVVSPAFLKGKTALTITVLRLRLHVFHGGGICPRVPGRQIHFRERTPQRTLRRLRIHRSKLPNRNPLPLYVCPILYTPHTNH
jgi:hypothetical protein